jgi:hypothetical protein
LMAVVGLVQIRASQQVSHDIKQIDESFELLITHKIAELTFTSDIFKALDQSQLSLHEMLLGERGTAEKLNKSVEDFDKLRTELEESIKASSSSADKAVDLKELALIEEKHSYFHEQARRSKYLPPQRS